MFRRGNLSAQIPVRLQAGDEVSGSICQVARNLKIVGKFTVHVGVHRQ